MKVVSLVPSWTETLIAADVDVVGRTRYCIHPKSRVSNVAVVGGTKDVDWKKVDALNPDLILFDREENTLEMAKSCPYPWHSTHVRSIVDMSCELNGLSEKLSSEKLRHLAERWDRLLTGSRPALSEPPARISWEKDGPHGGPTVYVIWAKPWMAAGAPTFIGSVLELCGWMAWGDSKYPEFDPDQFRDLNTTFLCPTEPFPFAKRKDLLATLPGRVALVDGEKLSWFGVRTLEFLESLITSQRAP